MEMEQIYYQPRKIGQFSVSTTITTASYEEYITQWHSNRTIHTADRVEWLAEGSGKARDGDYVSGNNENKTLILDSSNRLNR